MATADVLEAAHPKDPELPLAAAMVEVLLAEHAQVVATVNKALENNPSADDRRALQGKLIALKNREDALVNALIQLDAAGRDIPTPSDEMVQELAKLAEDVERATNQRLAAAEALGLATQFVTLASDVLTAFKIPDGPRA
ncbi:MAG TPA: hypothetical protein VFB75_20045 [Burkholderiales bacterium]|nr:hypothetical protein [Burkholderiales bacterium]